VHAAPRPARRRLTILALAFILPASLTAFNRDVPEPFAYEPAVATPLGPYLMRDGLKGPLLILALNEKNEITQTSRLKYDDRGRLLVEAFFDNRNNPTGEVRYTHEKGLPTREDYFDSKGELVSSKIRTYQQNQLIRIAVEEKKVIKFLRSYSYSKDRISIRESIDKTYDVFQIALDGKGRPVSMELIDLQKKPLQTIEYKYDTDGRLKERLRTMQDSASRCQYEYDETGRLYQYIYFDRSTSDWKKTRTIRLIYADRV
jgi:YD repeat-containing protein